ncbi:hypothetical protein IG631_23321 [Alternaria alternata]|nr:hypothetical protein IG631_23321 [Alternaria alternata]
MRSIRERFERLCWREASRLYMNNRSCYVSADEVVKIERIGKPDSVKMPFYRAITNYSRIRGMVSSSVNIYICCQRMEDGCQACDSPFRIASGSSGLRLPVSTKICRSFIPRLFVRNASSSV